MDNNDLNPLDILIENFRDYTLSGNPHNLDRASKLLEGNPKLLKPRVNKWLLRYLRLKLQRFDMPTLVFYIDSWRRIYLSHPPNYGSAMRYVNTSIRSVWHVLYGKMLGIHNLPPSIRMWIALDMLATMLETPDAFPDKGSWRITTQSERMEVARCTALVFKDISMTLRDEKIEIDFLKNLVMARSNQLNRRKLASTSRLCRAKSVEESIILGNNDKSYVRMRLLQLEIKSNSSSTAEEIGKVLAEARSCRKQISERSTTFEMMYFEILESSAKKFLDSGQLHLAIREYQNTLKVLSEWEIFDQNWKANMIRVINTELSRMLMKEGRYQDASIHLETAIELSESSLNKSDSISVLAKFELTRLKANLALMNDDYSLSAEYIDQLLGYIDELPGSIKGLSDIKSLLPFPPTPMGVVSLVLNKSEFWAKLDEVQLRAQRFSELTTSKPLLIVAMKIHFTLLKQSISRKMAGIENEDFDLSGILLSIPEISNFQHLVNRAFEFHFDDLSPMVFEQFFPNILESLEEEPSSVPDFLFLRDLGALVYSLIGLGAAERKLCEASSLFKRAFEILILELGTKTNVIPYSVFSILSHFSKALELSDDRPGALQSSFLSLIPYADTVLMKLETIRCTFVDHDDRARLESLLENSYSVLSESLSCHIFSHTNPSNADPGVVQAMLVFLDRSRLRWAQSIIPNQKPLIDFAPEIPQSLVQEYLLCKKNLILSKGDFFSVQLESDRFGVADIQEIAGKMYVQSFGRLGSPDYYNVDIDPEIFKGRKSEDDYIAKCNREFRSATQKIQAIDPLFEPDLVNSHARSIGQCFGDDPSDLHLHLQRVANQLVIALHCGSTAFSILQAEETQLLVDLEQSVLEWLSPERTSPSSDFSCGTKWDNDPFEASPVLFTLATKISELIAGIPALQTTRLRIVIDPTLSWLPVHLLKCNDSEFPGYVLEKFEVAYSPSIAFESKSTPPSPMHELTAVVAAVCNSNDLPFARVESNAIWRKTKRTSRFLDNEVTLSRVANEVRHTSVFHFCGHTRKHPDSGDPYLDSFGSEKLSISRCLDTVRLLESPLVIINACRASLIDARSAKPLVTATTARQVRFDEKFASQQLSFATAFLLSGASAVIGTISEVGDLPAALFAWKFSEFYELNTTDDPVATSFHLARSWIKDGIRSGDLLMNEIFPEFLAAAQENGDLSPELVELCKYQVSQVYKQSPQSPPFSHPRHWAPFILHR